MIENSSGMNRQSLDQAVIVTRGMPGVQEQCDEICESCLRLSTNREHTYASGGDAMSDVRAEDIYFDKD